MNRRNEGSRSRRSARGRWPATLGALLIVTGLLGGGDAQAQEIHGFVENLEGVRTAEGDGFERGSYTASETRVQLKVSDYSDVGEYFVRVDFPYDRFTHEGLKVELREGYFTYTGSSWMDFKFGRQITTWGTGDLLFINDVFPKDWESFFIGRETQYLKAPMDALRFAFYNRKAGNLDVVVMPWFEPDRLPRPDRLAFYNPFSDLPPQNQAPLEPGGDIDESELALRGYRNFGSTEVALYSYFGHYRQPSAFDTSAQVMRPYYSRLYLYGASARRGLLGGVFNLEGGYLDSRDDPTGANPSVENSSTRFMFGYDRQLWTDFQLGLQGYYEGIASYGNYKESLPPGAFVRDEWRQLYTARLTQFLKYQTIKLSLFSYWSPTDEDYYVRFSASYKLSDPIELVAGGNYFGGTDKETMFGQFDANDNLYFRARYSF